MSSYVVAGASRGLGLEFVVQLLSKGHLVVALVRNPTSGKGLAEIKNENLHVVKGDITDVASLKAAAAEVANITGGSLDVLINNAAYQNPIHAFHNIVQFSDDAALIDDFNTSWSTNVMGPILTTNAFLPLLKRGSLKKVLTISSGLGIPDLNLESGFPAHTSYCVSKCALEMVNVKYALALKDEGFIFLALSPGVVNTAEAAPPPGALVEMQKQAAAFLKIYPNWKGPMNPPESVGLLLNLLDNSKAEDNGKFLSHYGNKEWL